MHTSRGRKHLFFLLLFINIVSHSRLLFLLVHYCAASFSPFYIRIVVRFVVVFDYYICTTRPRANAFYVFRLLYNYVDFSPGISERNILKRLPKSRHLQPRISYFDRHISVNGSDYLCSLSYFLRVNSWRMKSSEGGCLKSALRCVERGLLQRLLSCDFASEFRHNITLDSDFLVSFSLSRSEYCKFFFLSLSLSLSIFFSFSFSLFSCENFSS